MAFGILFVFFLMLLFVVLGSLRIVPKGEVFIKSRLGRETGKMNPGLHFIIPFIETTIRQKTGTDQAEFSINKINTVITYEVKDALLLRQNLHDLGAGLKMASESTLKKHLNGNLEASSIELARIKDDCLRDLIDLFSPWGVDIKQAEFTIRNQG